MTSVDDWLNDEQFDFDVSASPIGDKALQIELNHSLEDDDDEEVFFGPQTHKERIAAVVVNEKEAKQAPIESLSAEEQALILKESALLSVKIKHGTPGNARSSPIAVVHPMRREPQPLDSMLIKDDTKENKENMLISKDRASTVAPPSKLKSSKILKSKFGSSKGRPASQPEPATTKLPISKTRGKIQSEFSEPLVDKVNLYGLNKATPSKTKKTSSSAIRRRSGLPITQTSEVSKTSSQQQAPALLPSAVPAASASRLRAPISKSTSDVKSLPKGPMRVTSSQSAIASGLPQSNLRMPSSSRKSIASIGTPKKNSNIPSSAKHRSKTTTTPSATASERCTQQKRNSLVTPVQRTPSSRKQITARQLVTRERSTSRTPSPNDLQVIGSNQEPAEITPVVKETPKVHAPCPPSHSDILDRYKRLKQKQESTEITNEKVSVEPIERTIEATEVVQKAQKENKEKENTIDHGEKNEVETTDCQEATLVNIHHTVSSLMEMSPMKTKDYFLDPFHTGATPPPLIDVMDVLEPERPAEVNLIEF